MVFQHPFRDVKTVSKSIRLVLKKIPEFVPIPRNKPGCQGSCFSMLFNFQGPFPLLRAELYLSTFPEVCQQQVSVFVSVKGRALRPFRDSFAIIPRPFPFVNSFFAPFCKFFICASFSYYKGDSARTQFISCFFVSTLLYYLGAVNMLHMRL